MEDSKLRRDVMMDASVSSVGSPAAIISMMSGKEEMFAFQRAVSPPNSNLLRVLYKASTVNMSAYLQLIRSLG